MQRLRSHRLLLALALFVCGAVALRADEAKTAAKLESIRQRPLELRRFVEALPKGGDLHNHLSGSVYAETFIALAAKDGLCVDTTASKLTPCAPPNTVLAATALTNPPLYQQLLDAMSMRQFRPVKESGHDHFFNTFGKFGAASWPHVPDMLLELVRRAANDNVDYVETMLAPDLGKADKLVEPPPAWKTFDELRAAIDAKQLDDAVATAQTTINNAEAFVKSSLKCGTPSAERACDTVLRYVYEVHRGGRPEQVFAEMLVGFELATRDGRVVSVNPVMAEDWYVPMRDFKEHMEMFRYFRLQAKYSAVRVTSHAGELAPGLVPPEGMRFHVHDTVFVAGAERIGHGVDIMRETDAEGTLQRMASKPVAVEICLTSNDVILGVRGKEHPFRTYMEHAVPLVLATDDAGVSRGDLSTELQRAVEEQGATYPELKQLIRNSLQFSFLQGTSVWRDRTYSGFVDSCKADVPGKPLSASCQAYLAAQPKAKLQWRLEERLGAFEER